MKYGLFALFALGLLPACSHKKKPSKAENPQPRREMARERAQEQQAEMEMDDMSMTGEEI